jgi:hypothetical protein
MLRGKTVINQQYFCSGGFGQAPGQVISQSFLWVGSIGVRTQ